MNQHPETRCVHGGSHRFPDGRDSISMPIYQTATFAHPDLGHSPDRFYYTRLTNPPEPSGGNRLRSGGSSQYHCLHFRHGGHFRRL